MKTLFKILLIFPFIISIPAFIFSELITGDWRYTDISKDSIHGMDFYTYCKNEILIFFKT
jgi:hypothetical protein